MKTFLKLQAKKEFAWVNWTKEQILKLPNEVSSQKKKVLEQVKSIPESNRTFENTIGAIERADEAISDTFARLEVLLNAHPNKNVRGACAVAITELSNITTDMTYDESLYTVIANYRKYNVKETNPSHEKLLKETLDAYRRLGFELPKTKRLKVQKLFKDLQAVSQKFSTNINEWRGSILVSEKELEGTPLPYQKSLQKKGLQYVVTTDYPSMNPFLTFSKSELKRKELWTIAQQKGGKQNLAILKKILFLRKRIAQLTGYQSWAHYQLENYLVKTPEKARKVIEEVLKGTRKSKDTDLQALKTLKQKDSSVPFGPWDIAYYDNLLREVRFKIDENEIREHLPLNHVLETMLSVFGDLMNINFKKVLNVPTWHKDVITYEVSDRKSKEIIGYLFLDLFPREGKYSYLGAAFPVSDSRLDQKSNLQRPTCVALMCNFAKPTKGTLSLLSHTDVEVIFHEFGHALHSLLSKTEYTSQSSNKTKLDFIEAPSQLLEYWAWDKKVLAKLTRHYLTGNQLPKQKIGSLVKSQYHLRSLSLTKQMLQTILSLDIHQKDISDTKKYFESLVKQHLGFDYLKKSLFPAGFGHLPDYAAAYYVYVYSKIYCDDFAEKFKRLGLNNKKVGMLYRKEILEQGAMQEEDESARLFLGRKVNTKAFLKEV